MARTKVRITSKRKSDIHFRCAPCDFQRLCKIAADDRRSVSNLVEKIIVEWLARADPSEVSCGIDRD